MSRLKTFLYVLLQYSWGLLQNLVGTAVFLLYLRRPHFRYRGAVVTIWPVKSGSMSMGRYLFLDPSWTPADQRLLAHEYGHTYQSLLLGPLYLFVIGLPSFLWAALPPCRRLRRTRHVPYSALYTERWADSWGARFAKTRPEPHFEITL